MTISNVLRPTINRKPKNGRVIKRRDFKMTNRLAGIRLRSGLEFQRVVVSALTNAEQLVPLWLPHGRRKRNEWVVRNPTRSDRRPGSFKVNLRTGQWADFATGDAGGDLISLRAYLDGVRQSDAARRIARELAL
jgi:hypothetical protein